MNCDTFNIWRPTPDGATVAIQAAGNEDMFRVEVRVTCSGGFEDRWVHSELVPGPKTKVMNSGTDCTFTILMNVTSKPDDPITATATLTAAGGTTILRTCTWEFTAPGASAVVIDVLTS
jgi:hypothetical protein